MYKQFFSALAGLAAAAAFALTPGVALAQHHGGGGGHTRGGVHTGGAHVSRGFHAGGAHVGGFHRGGAVGHAAVHHGAAFNGAAFHHAGGFNGAVVRHGGFDGHRGGAFYGRHYGYYHNRGGRWGYGGWGYPAYGLGLGLVSPGYSNYAYSPTYNYDYGAYYDTYPYDYDAYPYYADTYPEPAYGDLTAPPFGAGAYVPPAPAADEVAHMHVIVPPDAQVWFNGSPTQQTGAAREFASPPLVPGQDYTYDITARWTAEGGQVVTQTRHVDVRANTDVTVDFTRPAPGQ